MFKHVVLVMLLLTGLTPAAAAPQRFSLDSAHTTVAFLVDHVGYAKTLGYFSDVSGSFNYDADTRVVSDISITVQTESVQSDHKARDKHVRSKDFLNVKKFPQMTFTASQATVNADGKATVAGELELLGQSQPLTLNVTLNKADNYPFGHKSFTLGVSARAMLLRSDYGMTYGVANGLVGDDIELIIESEANRN